LRFGSFFWGALFVGSALFLYFRPAVNISAGLPLLLGGILLPFFVPNNLGITVAVLSAAFSAALIAIAVGVKNLILINRDMLREAGVYVMAYCAFTLFFMQAVGNFFIPWVYALIMALAAFGVITQKWPLVFAFGVVIGELLWIVSWLPIGFLASANMCFAVVLFTADAVREGRLNARKSAAVAALLVFILLSSRWVL
jgi:hypothetical protein